MTIVGLISPGAMGVSVGAAALGNSERVIWAGEGRSPATHERATQAGLTDCGTQSQLFDQSDIVLSVCPPHDATLVANAAAAHGFSGLYLEGNAIAPQLTRELADTVTSTGARFVDGGIIGGPAWDRASGTTLWLAGEDSAEIVALFEDSPLHTAIAGTQAGKASALKMTFAAYTKGSTALLMAILAVAEKEGVRDQLEAQWGESFTGQTHHRVTTNAAKAWRFVGEMEEIARTFDGIGLPGFHGTAADVYSRLAEFKDAPPPAVETLLASLLASDK